jgi:hypothetical protein
MNPLSRSRVLLGSAAAGVVVASLLVSGASAANSPTFRDCSLFSPGVDPDFVRISKVTVGSGGKLTVPRTQGHVKLLASESSDPGDSANHVTFKATVKAPGVQKRKLSGNGTGKVKLSIPLAGMPHAKTYTISWAATFDNGNHSCPSSQTPENTKPSPFVVKAG